REGVEAALIVSIILAYLAKTGNMRHFGKIWLGTGAAIAVSVGVGLILFITIGGLKEPAEQIFEGTAMILAAAVVTWMLFWMRRTAANVKGELHASVDRRLVEGSVWGLAILAFTAVIREGIETSPFLMAQAQAASQADGNAFSTLLGAVIGLVIAAILGFGFYRGARVINLRTFFQWTGVALVFIAAGLLSHGIHEFIEAGVISVGTATAFDISTVLSHDEGIGQWLRAIFGYSSAPEWITLLSWLVYVVGVLVLYLRPVKPSIAESRPAPKAAV
ncbi:MAG TPA: iron uptake transporter permease EfeU, partial [Candidatus Limnocylindria bacterium]|nr:iron uptake transporter permease EfeU [Candidatus Limnocylindria bacterium]